jgi:hypothetical protein
MRSILLAIVLASLGPNAWAQDATSSTDPMAVNNAEMSAESEVIMQLHDLQTKLTESGYRNVEVLPRGVMIQATDRYNRVVRMLVDIETMTSFELEPPLDDAATTTGSRSSVDPAETR